MPEQRFLLVGRQDHRHTAIFTEDFGSIFKNFPIGERFRPGRIFRVSSVAGGVAPGLGCLERIVVIRWIRDDKVIARTAVRFLESRLSDIH